MKMFIDICIEKIKEKDSSIIVGLDPHFDLLPDFLKAKVTSAAKAGLVLLEFNKKIIDAIHDLVPAIKPQIAFYERFGLPGLKAYRDTIEYAHGKGLLVIGDVKRNDIGPTAKAYSDAHIGKVEINGKKYKSFDSDAITVNSYLGSDGIMPFIEDSIKYGKGIFVLVKTSNKSSVEIQDLIVIKENKNLRLYEVVGSFVKEWGNETIGKYGYSAVGAVVGATFPEEIKSLRKIMPNSYFLIPGIGAQGGAIKDVLPAFDPEGLGALITVSRSVIFAYQNDLSLSNKNYDVAARNEVIRLNRELRSAISK